MGEIFLIIFINLHPIIFLIQTQPNGFYRRIEMARYVA